jgi:hypothetical protein
VDNGPSSPETMFAVSGWVFTIDNYVHLLGSGFARAIFNSLPEAGTTSASAESSATACRACPFADFIISAKSRVINVLAPWSCAAARPLSPPANLVRPQPPPGERLRGHLHQQ